MTVLARITFLAALLLAPLVPVARAGAQRVEGHRPQNSPFRDLEYRQELTVFGGQFAAGKDPAGVAPREALMFGARYDFRVGGPAYLFARTQYTLSDRTVIDPRLPAATRVLGEESANVLLADIGLALNLTGFKSWHGIVPIASGGLGIATDFRSDADPGTWRFGTPFLITLGLGAKWVTSERWHLRADITNNLYQIKYPTLYYTTASDGTSVLDPDDSRNVWKANYGFTLGLAYQLFR